MPVELPVLFAWAIGFGLTYVLTPRLMVLAHATGMIDVPRGRHVHQNPTPLLGGAAIFAGVMVGAVLFAPEPALIITATMALAVGFYDDYRKCKSTDLPGLAKLVLQLAPAITLIGMGHTIEHITNPFGSGMLILPWWVDVPLTLAWLIGMTNAVNFLDGMDGLVAGVVGVAAFTLLVMALATGSISVAVWVAGTLGACIAFLRYNFHPARIFMGDSGTNFLGFLLAALAITGYFKAATLAGLAAPLLALFLPVFNVFFVVARRLHQGKGLVQSLTEGDLEHSFNVLHRKMGFNAMETVLVFLLAAMLLSASALSVAWSIR